MVSSLFHIEKSQEIGLLYLADSSIAEGHTYPQLTKILLARLQLTQNMVSTQNTKVLDRKIKERVRQDFMDEDIVILQSWMLSRTEVTLCALAALLNDSQRNT